MGQFAAEPPPLPDEGPRGDDGQLGGQEYRSGYYETADVDAETVVGEEHGFASDGGFVGVLFEAEFVRDLDGLDEEHVVVGCGRGTASPPLAEGDDGT